MKKHSHEHDEYVSGVRAELLGEYRTDSHSGAEQEGLSCPFCRALERSEKEAGRRSRKEPKG
jgi:hypothetical protein